MKHLSGLNPFWSEELTDITKTSAPLSVIKPQRANTVFTFDKPWEGNNCNYLSIIEEDDFLRMYYESSSFPWDGPVILCYAESYDGGMSWERKNLGMYEYKGSYDNNILFEIVDNFTIMKDPNPDCPPEQLYKALTSANRDDGEPGNQLDLYACGDGIHFEKIRTISKGLAYDTQNTLFWNKYTKKYYAYMRDYHDTKKRLHDSFNEESIRGIVVMESCDLVNWSRPQSLDFLGGDDYPLYTNVISPYIYDDRYYIGFPTRYVERKEWNDSFEQLPGKEARKFRMEKQGEDGEPRYGLTLTDCVFMYSTDHYKWHRFDEACLVPDHEYDGNWLYGDCYPAVGKLIESPGRYEGYPNELSLFVLRHHWGAKTPVYLDRFVYRRDGFASYKAGYKQQVLTTLPFTFDGDKLSINFRTSARGYIYVRVLDEDGKQIDGFNSCEHFGDSLERIISFEKPLCELSGKAVRLEFTMSDAEIYSFTLH